MTLPIALMPPSATPIATTSLMVNCLRLRLLMVSVSIKPANGQSNRRRGHTVAHRPWRRCEFEHTGGPKSGFCGGCHTALPFALVGTTGSAAGAAGGRRGLGQCAALTMSTGVVELPAAVASRCSLSCVRGSGSALRIGAPTPNPAVSKPPSGCREAPCSVAPAVAPTPVPAQLRDRYSRAVVMGPCLRGERQAAGISPFHRAFLVIGVLPILDRGVLQHGL